jgi:putative glutamine amidotransferase
MLRPLIGITAYTRSWVEKGWDYDVSYASNATAIEAAGGLPVLIPAKVSMETLRAIYERLDGMLLPGGGDIDPNIYHAEKHKTTGGIDNDRDRTEIALTQWAYEDDLPTFGICRGIQVMNVALGGTLVQDIPSLVETELRHDTTNEPRAQILHNVKLAKDSVLAKIVGTNLIDVNSLHHQSIGVASPKVRVTGHAPDGVVESIEVPNKDFILAVQWHPEDLIDNDERMLNIFKVFIEKARARMQKKMQLA